MTVEKIRDLLHGSEPFRIRMVSGREIYVPHPDFMAITQSLSMLMFSDLKGRVEFIRINQIESIDTAAPSDRE